MAWIVFRTVNSQRIVVNWNERHPFINLRDGQSQTEVASLPKGIQRGAVLSSDNSAATVRARNNVQEMSDLRHEAQGIATEFGEELSRLLPSGIRVSTNASGEIDASQRWVNAYFAHHNLCANVIAGNRSIVPLRAAVSSLRSAAAVGVRAFLLGHIETDWNSTFRNNAYEIRSNFGRGSAILLTNARNPIRNFFDLGL